MINSVEISIGEFERSKEAAEKVINTLKERRAKKIMIEAGNEGLMSALRKHFAEREKEPRNNSGFPAFGQSYPKKYFWRGTRGTSVAESMRISKSDEEQLVGMVTIPSPALAHKLDPNPPDIKAKKPNGYLALPANPISAQWAGKARDFPGGLRIAFTRTADGHWLLSLIAAQNYAKKNRKTGEVKAAFGKGANTGENEVVFWLVHKVKTRHDPKALPPHDAQVSAVASAVRTAVARILAQKPS